MFYYYAECRYAKCRGADVIFMLNMIILILFFFVLPNVVMLSAKLA